MKKQMISIAITVCVFTGLVVSGCSSGSQSSPSSTTPPASTSPTTGTVNLVVQDTPATGITVLSFQLQIASATLQPGNVSILPRPVTVDLAQLVTDTSFLASQVVDSGTYASLTMTYQNPQITLMNSSNAPLVTPVGTCAVGQVCTFAPRLNNASVTVSSGVFPITISANSTTGLNLDLSITDLLQSDLSLTFASGQSVNLSLLSTLVSLTDQQGQIDAVLASVKSVSGTQATVQTALGDSLTIDLNTSTSYLYPAGVCATANSACLTTGQVVDLDLSLLGDGSLVAQTVTYADGSGGAAARATVLATPASGANSFQVLLHTIIPGSTMATGGTVATITPVSGANFSVPFSGYPVVNGGSFTSTSDLVAGQEILLQLASGSSSTTYNSSSIYLEPTQTIGAVQSVNAGADAFVLNGLTGLWTASRPVVSQIECQAGSATQYENLSPSSLAALTPGIAVGVKGLLFSTGTSGSPALSTVIVRGKP
jgi:predicted component of type VI protein secretion system